MNIEEPLTRIEADGTVRCYRTYALGSVTVLTYYHADAPGNVTVLTY